MPLQKQLVEVVFESALHQKIDKRSQVAGALSVCINADFDKESIVGKRRGFKRIDITTNYDETVNVGNTHALGNYEDELVAFTDYVLVSLGSRDNRFLPNSRAAVSRGKIPRCQIRRQDVAGSAGGLNPEGGS